MSSLLYCTRTVFYQKDIKNGKDINNFQWTLFGLSMFTTNIVPWVQVCMFYQIFCHKGNKLQITWIGATASIRTEDYPCEACLSSGRPRLAMWWIAFLCQGYLLERQRYTQLPEHATNVSLAISSTIPISSSLLQTSGSSKTAGLPTKTSPTSRHVLTVFDAASSKIYIYMYVFLLFAGGQVCRHH